MEAIIKQLDSGKVKITIYTPEYVHKVTHVKGLISDIYKNIEDFNKTIVWIMKIVPKEGKTEKDVIEEYFKTVEEKDYITFAQAGMLSSIAAIDDIEHSVAIINAEKDILFGLNFVNVLWNRIMAHVYGSSDYMLYQNKDGKAFVKDNLGADKLIARTTNK